MRVLVLNSGSSSIKCAVLDAGQNRRLLDLRFEGIGETEALIRDNGRVRRAPAAADHAQAFDALFEIVLQHEFDCDAVGHRIVHGGPRFDGPVRISGDVVRELDDLKVLAPLHNAACVAGIRATLERLPAQPQVAVFDTSFHRSLPPHARAYALPANLVERHEIRRYGFHGISHEYVAGAAAAYLERPLEELRIISCHLGSGSSITAIDAGRSVETSMGMTPLEGLVMGTRAGDIDAGVVLKLLRDEGLDADALDTLLNHHSGLLGMAGVSNMQEIEARAAAGDTAATLAFEVYCHRVQKYIGAYAAVMDGVDTVLMTGGIGERSAGVRERSLKRLNFIGAQLDLARNVAARVSLETPVAEISVGNTPVPLLVIATDEEAMIAQYTRELLQTEAFPPADAD